MSAIAGVSKMKGSTTRVRIKVRPRIRIRVGVRARRAYLGVGRDGQYDGHTHGHALGGYGLEVEEVGLLLAQQLQQSSTRRRSREKRILQ